MSLPPCGGQSGHGAHLCIEEIDMQGLHILDVSAYIDQRFSGFRNGIRLEPEFLEKVT